MRIFFGLILVICGYFFGSSAAAVHKKTVSHLNGMRELTEHLLRGITLTKRPLAVLFSTFCHESPEITELVSALKNTKKGIPRVFCRGMEELCLPPESKKVLTALGSELGMLPAEEQEKRFLYCISVLKKQETELADALRAKTKSIKTAGTLFGLLAAIILI